MPELYFVVAPEQAQTAGRWGCPLAHMAYGLGRQQLDLTVGALSLTARGGWMVLTDRQLPPAGDPRSFALQVRQECRRRQFQQVMADFEQPANDRAMAILDALTEAGLPLLVPPAYADALPRAQVLVDSAISGGDLTDYLTEQLTRWPGRVCLSLRRLRMRFSLPSPHSEGEELDGEALSALLSGRQSFFSHELGCRYCTVQEGERFSFVLFDDAASLRYKLSLADQLGIRCCVALYSDLAELLPQLLGMPEGSGNFHEEGRI